MAKQVTIETDHEPLITIVKKPLHSAPMRLQKMKLQLQRYTFNLIYKAGKELHIADTLSRAYIPRDEEEEEEEEFEVLELTCISKRRAEQIQEAMQESEELQQLKRYILNGWPNDEPPAHKHEANADEENGSEETDGRDRCIRSGRRRN